MKAFWKCVIIAALLVCGTMAQHSFRHPVTVTTSELVSKADILFEATGYISEPLNRRCPSDVETSFGDRKNCRPTKVTTSCCESVSKAHIPFKVTGYRRQNALKPCVAAIVFETEKGLVCSDPNVRWVQKKMKEVPEIE